MPRIKIRPYEHIVRKIFSTIEISVDKLKLDSSATINVSIFDEKGDYADFKALTLEGDNYAQWAADDSYIVQYVFQQLGFEPEPEPEGES